LTAANRVDSTNGEGAGRGKRKTRNITAKGTERKPDRTNLTWVKAKERGGGGGGRKSRIKRQR